MPNHAIETQIEDGLRDQVVVEQLRKAALATLEHAQQDEPCELALVVTNDEVLQELNRRFLGIDRPTDVLAFPDHTRGPFVGAPDHPRYLGDVVISLARAQAQAAEASHDPQVELQLLVVHGVLHLLGHDDTAQEARATMWSEQRKVLKTLGLDIEPPE